MPRSPVIDTHAHFYSREYCNIISEEGARFEASFTETEETFSLKTPAGSFVNLSKKFIDPAERIVDMNSSGVDIQAVSLSSPMVYWGDDDLNYRLSQAWNNGAIDLHRQYPDRIVVLATLPLLDPVRSMYELNRICQSDGVRGIYMGTNINNLDLDDKVFDAIFAKIADLNLPIFLHPLQTIGGKRMNAYFLANSLGAPFDTAIAACKLIFGGVLDKYPKLEISLPHAGGVLPILMGRLDHAWKKRAEAKHLAKPPSSYLRRFTYDTLSHSTSVLEFVISQVGVDRVMLGSDFCYDMGSDRPTEIVKQLNITEAERQLILGGTAARLLKI